MSEHPSTRAPSDADIARLLRQGDPEGARALIQSHGTGVLQLLRSRHGQDVALEALSEAYVKVSKSRSCDETKGPLERWLFVIADHCAVDIRSGKRASGRKKWEVALGEEVALDGDNSLDVHEPSPRIQAMCDALPSVIDGCLTPALRQVLEAWLAGGGETPSKDLAAELGRSVNSFDVNLTRAKKRIEQAMVDRGLYTEETNE